MGDRILSDDEAVLHHPPLNFRQEGLLEVPLGSRPELCEKRAQNLNEECTILH